MFNLDKFIADSVTFRPVSMFAPDIEANKEKLTAEIKGKKVCVIGGAMKYLRAIWHFCSYLFWPQWGRKKKSGCR